MSDEFVVILAGPRRDLQQAWEPVHSALIDVGFAAASGISRLELDADGGAFEVVDSDDLNDPSETWEVASIHEQSALIAAFSQWGGMALQYARRDFTFELGIGLGSAHTNSYLRLSTRVLKRLFEWNDIDRLYRLIVAVAAANGSSAGVGERDFELLNLDISQVENAVWMCPTNPEYPSSLGILSREMFPEPELKTKICDRFVLRCMDHAYYVLEELDFLDIYRSLALRATDSAT